MKNSAWFINISFLCAIVLSIFAIKQFMENGKRSSVVDNPTTPDAYILNADYIHTNESGKEDLSLFSPFVQHFQDQDRANLKTPRIKLYKGSQRWVITSKDAKSYHGIETFYLSKDVTIKQSSLQNKETTQLNTNSLTIFPKRDFVSTNDFVTITQPGLKMTGTGLLGDLKKGNIQILSNTKGQYDPSRKT